VAAIEDLRGLAHESAVQLAVSLGLTGELELVDQPRVPDEAPRPVEVLLADARGGRPELRNARLQLAIGREGVRIARSGYYPQLGLFGLLQYGNNAFVASSGASSATSQANPFSGLAGNLTLGATLNMNFFDTLNTWTSSRQAEWEVARLIGEQRRAERLVESDVRLAHARLGHFYTFRAPLVASRDVARDNLKILEGRYKNGDALILDLLDAQSQLIDAERQLTDVEAQLQMAWIELDAALGNVVGQNVLRQGEGK
jgi:outer membrane protein TolC